ncbi:hypothetical protein KSD_02510 [Ktedonobacter sp. SOSP1-85]|nr:hypothetical protein KSD_02510 [Ktedonobacter sp. SOSP1-85]
MAGAGSSSVRTSVLLLFFVLVPRSCSWALRFKGDRVAKEADPVDLTLADVVRLYPERRLARMADAGGL